MTRTYGKTIVEHEIFKSQHTSDIFRRLDLLHNVTIYYYIHVCSYLYLGPLYSIHTYVRLYTYVSKLLINLSFRYPLVNVYIANWKVTMLLMG